MSCIIIFFEAGAFDWIRNQKVYRSGQGYLYSDAVVAVPYDYDLQDFKPVLYDT